MLVKSSCLPLVTTLKKLNYKFVAITPKSHQRVLDRNIPARDLRDILGWNRPFSREAIDAATFNSLLDLGVLEKIKDKYISKIRFASLFDEIYLHSGFPTTDQDSVFFGPDTYRYARFLRQNVLSANRLVDIGCGSGAGGLCLSDRVKQICLADINPKALEYARINSEIAEISDRVEIIYSDVMAQVQGSVDLIISNPPYMMDDKERAYRHGGENLGAALSIKIVKEALSYLNDHGKLVLYTASAIVNGVDTFWEALKPLLSEKKYTVQYEELDPDVFGEELERPSYQNVDRLAVVGLVVIIN